MGSSWQVLIWAYKDTIKNTLLSYKYRPQSKQWCDFTKLLANEYSHTVNLVYPTGIRFSFSADSSLFAVSYLVMEIFGLASNLIPSSATIINNSKVSETAKFHLIIDKDSEFLDQRQSPYIIQIISDAFIVQGTLVFHSITIHKNGHGFVIDCFHNGDMNDKDFIRKTRQFVNLILLAASAKKDLMLPAEPGMAFLESGDESLTRLSYCDVEYLPTIAIFNVSLVTSNL